MVAIESAGEPQWVQVRNALSADIEADRFKVGDQLPTLDQLTQRFGVSRTPVQKALTELKAAGMVRGAPGLGVFVVAKSAAATADRRIDLDDVYSQLADLRSRVEILEAREAECPKE